MMNWLRRLFRPTLTKVTHGTTRKQGAVTYTSAAPQFHFTLFGQVAVQRAAAARKAAPPRRTPIKDALLGPVTRPLTDAQARALPVIKAPVHPLEDVRTVTGTRYPTRAEVLAARQAQQERMISGAARVVAPRLARQPTMQAPTSRKPIKVKAHTRTDGTHVAAYTRKKPGTTPPTREAK